MELTNSLFMLCSGCKDNGALYQVAWLDQRYELDIMNMTNISRVSFISDVSYLNLPTKFNKHTTLYLHCFSIQF